MGPAWCIDHVNGDSHPGVAYQAAAVAGYPAITLPVGKGVERTSVGLCLVGTAWSEPTLIGIAFARTALSLGDEMRPHWRWEIE